MTKQPNTPPCDRSTLMIIGSGQRCACAPCPSFTRVERCNSQWMWYAARIHSARSRARRYCGGADATAQHGRRLRIACIEPLRGLARAGRFTERARQHKFGNRIVTRSAAPQERGASTLRRGLRVREARQGAPCLRADAAASAGARARRPAPARPRPVSCRRDPLSACSVLPGGVTSYADFEEGDSKGAEMSA